MKDDEIIPLLHQLRYPAFFTRDLGFYERFLRHPAFDNNKKRIGKVIRISHLGMRLWQLHAEKEEEIDWNF